MQENPRLDQLSDHTPLGPSLAEAAKTIDLWRDPERGVCTDGIGFSNWGNHSPTGFEWGHGGSGPAALAADLLIYCGARPTVKDVRQNYQQLKEDLVEKMPRNGPIIYTAYASLAGLEKQFFALEKKDALVCYEFGFRFSCDRPAVVREGLITIDCEAIRNWLAAARGRVRSSTPTAKPALTSPQAALAAPRPL